MCAAFMDAPSTENTEQPVEPTNTTAPTPTGADIFADAPSTENIERPQTQVESIIATASIPTCADVSLNAPSAENIVQLQMQVEPNNTTALAPNCADVCVDAPVTENRVEVGSANADPFTDQAVEDCSSSAPLPQSGRYTPEVLIFGETGMGKSSIINMLAGQDIASVSNDALGCTFGNVRYPVDIDGTTVNIWDTAGLNEGEHGSVAMEKAYKNLEELERQLDGHLNLLVYCIRGTRYRDIVRLNYDIFRDAIFNGKVPIIIVVTGLEHEEPMESWWEKNEVEFTRRKMAFDGHACVATTKGKLMKSGGHMYEAEYAESTEAVRRLIKTHISNAPRRYKPEYVRAESNALNPPWMATIRDRLRRPYRTSDGLRDAKKLGRERR